MRVRQTLPDLWLLSDERNDALLERVLRSYTVSIAFVFRHYFLPPAARLRRFRTLQRICREQRHLVILADSPQTAKEWGAQGVYGAPLMLAPRRNGLISVATAHNMRELAAANRMDADLVMLSPVFPTRSHPGAKTLGPIRFRLLAQRATMPVIALGGMDRQYANRMRWERWAGVDGLSTGCPRPDF
jgi:thiamine-phosphate pyrophosphorylase